MLLGHHAQHTNQSKYKIDVLSSLNMFEIKNVEDFELISSLNKQIIHIM